MADKTEGVDMKDLPAELTTNDLARLAGVTPSFIRLVISEGKLRATKRGRDWLVSRYEAQRWLEQRRDAAQ